MSDKLRTLPANFGEGGAGLSDGTLRDALKQVRGLKVLPLASGAGITAGVVATLTKNDAAAVAALEFDGRLLGNHGNNVWAQTIRRVATNLDLVFDLLLWWTYATARSGDKTATFTAVAATDVCTAAAHGYNTADPVQVSNSGGGLPAGLSALTPYFVIRVSADTFKLATTIALARAGTAVDITTAGTGTQTVRDVVSERFEAVSMVDAHPRYVETVVNGSSDLVTVLDLDSVTADQRPADFGPTRLASGANEVSLTGVERGDFIAAVIDITTATTPVAIATTDFNVADHNKVVSTAGVAATHGLLLYVLPKAGA